MRVTSRLNMGKSSGIQNLQKKTSRLIYEATFTFEILVGSYFHPLSIALSPSVPIRHASAPKLKSESPLYVSLGTTANTILVYLIYHR